MAVTTGVRFRLSGLSGDANLQLLDSSSVLQSSSNPDSTAEMVTAHLSAGTYYVRVYASGADVNTSYGLSVVIDTIAPVVTAHLENDTVLVYNTAPVAGADWITSIATIIGSVSETHLISSFQAGFENKTIANYVNVLPQMQADGSFSLSRSLLDTIYGGSLPEGVHTLTLLAQDEFGNLSTPFSLTFTLDTIAPTVPTIALIPESDSGSSHQDRVTKVNNPMIRGVAEAGSLVIIYRDYGTDNAGRAAVYANSNGIWQAGYADLTDGVHTFKVEAGDVAGNISAVSDTLSVTIDTVAPTLTISSLSNNATLMNNARLVGSANGTGSVIDSVSYYFDTLATGQSPISVTVQADGGFDVAIDFTGISNGAHTLTVKAIDLAGNEITLPPYSITVNRDLDAPIILAELVNDTSLYGYTNTDGITSDPTVSGTVTNVDQVTVLRAGFGNIQTANFIDITAQLQADGSFTLNQAQLEAIYGGTLSQGAHTLHLQAEDEQGNLSELFDLTFNLDTQAPIAPVNLSWTAVGTTAVKISGSAEAGALVELYEGTDLIAETYADATGNWRVTTSQLRNGTHSLSATATDLAGNTSPASTATSLSINTLVPAMPQGVRLMAATDSGLSSSDGITSDATPTVMGTAEAGATVRLLRGQQLLGQTIADANGEWSVEITSALPAGNNLLSAIAHNANGDSQAATLMVTVDATAPTAQIKTLAADSNNPVVLENGATLTMGTRLVGAIDGTLSAVASLRYQLGNLPEVTVPVAENGLFLRSLDFGGLSGVQTLTITSTDVAGNETSQSYSVTLNTTGTGVNLNPVLLAQLTQNTGNATDEWTYLPGISGVVSAPSPITGLQATFDQTANATFQDVTEFLHPDGTFTLSEAALAALTEDGLADGTYTLRLKLLTADNQMAEKSVLFKLDRSAPETSLPDVIDGIAWERGMHLQGTVQDNLNDVEVVYAIERTSDGQSIAQHSFTVAGSTSGTAFDQVISELAANNSVLQDEEVYNLIVTSTDVAGNSQRTRFQFFVPGDRRVTDDDQWTEDDDGDPMTPIKDRRPTDPNVQPTPANVNTWGYVGGGGNWGYYGGGGSGGGWTPGYDGGLNPGDKDGQKGPTGSGYEYEYAESINAIVHQAVDFISTSPETIHKKGALDNRQNILLEIGRRLNDLIQADEDFTNDQALIEWMRPAMEGLFADAYDPTGATAGVFDSFVPWGGAWLAQGLVQDPLSVREQVFQATLLEVVTEVFNAKQIAVTQTQQGALTTAVMELAKTYAWLNPNPEATVPPEDEAFGFLDLLWRLQIPDANGQFKGSGDIAAALQKGVSQLGQLLDGVEDPVRAIQFINNLMQAAAKVPSLKNDLKDARLLRELMEFGFEFVKSNPTVNQSATDAAVQGFLDRLWRGDAQQVKQAQSGLSAFFSGMDTGAERIKGLDFAVNLLDAAELLQGEGLERQKHDPVFLDALMGLGGAYTALNPYAAAGVENTGLFLNTLWQSQSIQKGTQEIAQFFENFSDPDSRTALLQFERNLLTAFHQPLELQEQMRDASFVSQVINFGSDYSGLRALEAIPEVNEDRYPFVYALLHADDEPLREIANVLAETAVRALSAAGWRFCFFLFSGQLLEQTVRVSRSCFGDNRNVFQCFDATFNLLKTLLEFRRCLRDFDDGNPSHKISPNDPTLLKIDQLIKRLSDWVQHR
ncbi:Ig-like domain-containing protein (plasmid) [Kovacikia minuta CCNUW1]|uniref:Ig-like domain-containing protein n=1 Tax=Kovacikia minuta TaxID=2931930 RepID=UPI001CCBBD62|nr:Ig-like domain-containing protein [Kovacikia minuta]UBF30710.1 Ig-like domain-containing protein [Kovacikia minuta CCNUW1]